MKTKIWFLGLLLLTACSGGNINISTQVNEQIEIFPDYDGVTIPVNMAPLNCSVHDGNGDYALVIKGGTTEMTIHAKDGNFDIPVGKWHDLLEKNAGADITLTIAKKEASGWCAYP